MTITMSVLLIGLAATLFIATLVATRRARPPWWVEENLLSIVVLPLILMVLISGILHLGAVIVTGALRSVTLVQLGASLVLAAVFTVACMLMLRRLRAGEASAASATVVPITAAEAAPAPHTTPHPETEPRKAA